MNAHALLKRFDIVADQSANIPALRRLVVDLAVRGKLLPTEELDMGVQEMLGRISAKVNELALAGLIKKQKPLSKIGNDEVPAAYLAHCVFARLGNIANLQKGLTGIQSSLPGDYPLVVTAAERGTCNHFDFDGAAAIIPLVSSTGHGNASINRLHYQDGKFALGTILCAVIPFDEQLISARFLYEYLTAFKEELLVSKMIGTANVTLTLGKIAEVPVPILAPAVQRRVDELMALCDQLEVAQQERERRRDRLAAASLQRLNQPAADTTPEAQRGHARFHMQNLPRLTTRPEHIKAMRQTILNLAVRGRLVQQEMSEESAAELLVHINAEKTRLVKSGALKKINFIKPIQEEELLFPLPEGWTWVRIGDLLLGDSQNGYSKRPDDAVDGIPILRISAGTVRQDGVVAEEEFKLIGGITAAQRRQYELVAGDLLACRFNGNRRFVGRITLYTGYLGNSPIYPDKLIRLRLLPGFVLPELVRHFAESEPVRKDIEGYCATTVGNWGISAGNMKAVKIPLPPLAEQHRIIAKVDELMTLCDQLEAQIASTQTHNLRLLGAVLDGALGIVRVPKDSEVSISPSLILDSDLQIGKASRFMTTNPAMTVDQLLECIDDLGGSTSPDRLLTQTGLGEDVEAFYDLLRAARDSGMVTTPLGNGEIIQRRSNAD